MFSGKISHNNPRLKEISMFIYQQKLIHLPVFTESGAKLGHIIDMEIDIEDHHVRKYIVGKFLGKETYLITPVQIKSISEDKIIVEDTILKEKDIAPKKRVVPPAMDTPLGSNVQSFEIKPE